MRVIGIVGRAFCGSTILSRLLNAIPGVVSVGEAYQVLFHASYARCTVCGPQCEFIKPSRFAGVNDSMLYDSFGQTFHTQIIAVSDKLQKRYQRYIQPHHEFDGIVLFKQPEAFAASDKRGHANHRMLNGKQVFNAIPVTESLRLTADYYEGVLQWSAPRSKVYVELNRIVENPQMELDRICDALDMPYGNVGDFDSIKWHNVMGNNQARKATKLEKDERWRTELTPLEKSLVGSNNRMRKLMKTLMELS